ncbi:MAG: exodeoxyribonuclease VII small subunit [Rikenellaceae bacterium]|nr:exodeoxyribonuclease VII small subunit [Rikenellaceae bacterium]
MGKKELTYSEAIVEIEQILARLKSEQTDVDKLAAEVKRATELIAQCKARLIDVEATVKAELEEK